MTFKIKPRLGRIFVLNNNAVDIKLFGVLLVLDNMIHGFFYISGNHEIRSILTNIFALVYVN